MLRSATVSVFTLLAMPVLLTVQPLNAAKTVRMSMTQRQTVDPVEDLGEPVHKTVAPLGDRQGPSGEPQACFFVEGNRTTTGEFAVVDLRSKQTVLDVRIPSGNGSSRTMSVSPVDGAVYFVAENTRISIVIDRVPVNSNNWRG